jgi:hypothetical protein
MPLRQRRELLPRREVFGDKIAAGAKDPICQREEEHQQTEYAPLSHRGIACGTTAPTT